MISALRDLGRRNGSWRPASPPQGSQSWVAGVQNYLQQDLKGNKDFPGCSINGTLYEQWALQSSKMRSSGWWHTFVLAKELFSQLGLSKLTQNPEIIFGIFNVHAALGVTFSGWGHKEKRTRNCLWRKWFWSGFLGNFETADTLSWEVPRDSLLTRQAPPMEKIILKWLFQQLGYPNECTHTFSWEVPRDLLLMKTAEIQGWH